MTVTEMSNEFDILYNNIMSNQAPGIDEYEKSVFLTKAQYEILKAYFEARGNKYLQGFDGSEQRQMDFSSITKTTNLQYIDIPASDKFDMRSKSYLMPKDCFIIVNEQIIDYDDHDPQSGAIFYTIEPITYQKYAAQMTKPYKYPPKHIVWRLITKHEDIEDPETICEIIGKFGRNYDHDEAPIYKMRYLRKPNPIILVNLNDEYEGLTIEGKYSRTSCELPDDMHHTIVQRAVELATASYNPSMTNVMTGIGNISSTNLGVIPQGNKD